MKPLAEHGTTARAKGRPSAGIPGCNCTPCRRAENAYDKRRRFLNQTGRSLMVETAPVAAHLRGLFEAGAGWVQLAAVSGCSTSTMYNLLAENNPRCRRTTANKILAIRPGDAIPDQRAVPAIGAVRRVRALMALAHACKAISHACQIDHSTVTELLAGRLDTITLGLANRVNDGFRALAPTTGTSLRSRNRARRERWAPPVAWSGDAIDDPAAVPDWTGHCGTDHGWWLHSLNSIPVCPPCTAAHEQWKTDRAHLTHSERWSEIGKARAAASNRGAVIAADGRELLGYGVPIDQAAARLGVTRQHLQQELIRHPQPETELAA
jgi:hypothetical protein